MGACQSRSCDSHLPICTTPPSSAPCPGPTANSHKAGGVSSFPPTCRVYSRSVHSFWFCTLRRIASFPSLSWAKLPATLEAFRDLSWSLLISVSTPEYKDTDGTAQRWHGKKTNQALKASESILRVFCKPQRAKSQGPLLSDYWLLSQQKLEVLIFFFP